MVQVAFPERHEETDAFDPRDIQRQGLDLLVVEQVHILFSDLREIIHSLDLHGLRLYPVSVLPVGAFCRYFADIDFRVKVRGKRISVIPGIAVQDINIVYFVKIMFQCIGGKHTCHSRIKAASQKCGQPGRIILLPVRPLPFILKLRRVLRFIIRCVNIVDACCQARVHDRKVLIRQRQIEHHFRLFLFDQSCQRLHIIRVHLRGRDLCLCSPFQLLLKRIAL